MGSCGKENQLSGGMGVMWLRESASLGNGGYVVKRISFLRKWGLCGKENQLSEEMGVMW